MKVLRVTAVMAMTLGCAVSAMALPITFNFSGTSPDGGALSAQAIFAVNGAGQLQITLSNLAADADFNSELLTALFFDTASPVTLTPVSAILSADSFLIDSPNVSSNVGGEWRYDPDLSSPYIRSATQGISAVGFSLFGSAPNFNGPNLGPPPAIDGPNYGIVPITYNAADDQGEGNLSYPRIQYSVIFTLSGIPAGFDPSTQITNVSVQYGTDLATEPNLPPEGQIPEPTSLVLLGTGLLVAGMVARYKSSRR